jgi:dipeptidyl aminopeptidase/acylaminoacyl peptidase
MHQKLFILLFMLALCNTLSAQDNSGYQVPPQVIADLADAPTTPQISISPAKNWVLMLETPGLPPISELAQAELKIAGLRINPAVNSSSRSAYYNGIKLKSLKTNEEKVVKGLPANPIIENLSWSPQGDKALFTLVNGKGLELWVLELDKATVRKLTEAVISDVMPGLPYAWFADGKTALLKTIPKTRGAVPQLSNVPTGPTVQVNEGKAAPVRTYQDLLKNKNDEALFDYYCTSQLQVINLSTGTATNFGMPSIYGTMDISPNGAYVLMTKIKRPYSYIVPYSMFAREVSITDTKGNPVKVMVNIPPGENLPKGFNAVQEGPRNFSWRADAPATLYWIEAQDGGDPAKKVEVRDKLYSLAAPFTGQETEVMSFNLRFAGLTWGNDQVALAYETWTSTRKQITSTWSPGSPANSKKVLFDRSSEDRYNDPGSFLTAPNAAGRNVLLSTEGGKTLWLAGQGASSEGDRPFIDKFSLESKKAERVWRSEAPYFESPVSVIDAEKGIVLTSRESQKEVPNYHLRNLQNGQLQQFTRFANPYKALEGVSKELVKYKRDDGVELSGTLYLPAGYNQAKDGRLPVFMWAYPLEYKTAEAAGQVSGSPHRFTRLSWGSPLFWLTRGYAVFDNFSMPIVGAGDKEPNDSYVEQLRAGAEAAVKTLTDRGVADPKRLAVGGHSYGAFMTANLLAHTDLFAAGVARSGAYNRTLTPFGFQSEERTFWEAPEVYSKMSPFNYADKIKEPILLIHGEADDNQGTFPVQSERFYAALKGHGATAKLVLLPHEAHGYRAKESIFHMLYEMDAWMEKHVKNRSDKAAISRP